MRTGILIAITGLLLLPLAAAAAEPRPIETWQDAIRQLSGEREKAETCIARLRAHGDAYRMAQGEQHYAAAKAHMDLARGVLQQALAGGTAKTGSGAPALPTGEGLGQAHTRNPDRAPDQAPDQVLAQAIADAIEGRLKLCALLDDSVPDAGGEKGLLAQVMEPTQVPTQAAARLLLAERTAAPLQRMTIDTQLAALAWAAPAALPMVNETTDDDAVYPVWFGTNRRPDPEHPGRFTDGRNDRITYGRAEVFIPAAHRFGETGNPLWQRLLRFELRDDRLRLQAVAAQDQAAWLAEIQATLAAARADGEPSHALVFLHGYNVSFADAAIQAAQIGFDLKVPGATAFFSWPSKGKLAGYAADEDTIEASEAAITEFLVTAASRLGADRVHLVAHSMGNRGLLRALQRIAADAETRGKVRFGQIFLAAPDLGRDLFLDLAALYPAYSARTTLYASDGDLALLSSRVLHAAPRAGYFEPYTVAPGIDTVAVPDFNLDVLGHGYFAQADALLGDLRTLMLHDTPPAQRMRLTPANDGGQRFWRMRR
ncbi:alpha/beta hydrolase [Thiohalocapsa sp. ML1]|uniref:alpha/beta hydrolase n=1 Tax=Thiohalocapsa sp. ML1 TaxID=1431688 RepID=UPI000731EEAA|nr:alpha/beta hydrolase [Thiohalocapsa sp. ML1]